MSSLTRYQFKTTITFIAPIISQSSGALRFGQDAAMLLDRNGTPAIPGTLIQGNLRQYLEELYPNEFQSGAFLFGKKQTDGLPHRGRLSFSEFWTYSEGKINPNLIYRIKINDKDGKTEDGALQVIESLFPAGAKVSFKGDIFGWLQDDNSDAAAKDFATKITKALYYMPAAGAFKGIGFGRVEKINITYQKITTETRIDNCGDTAEQIGLIIEPDRAFCFSRHLVGNNTRFIDAIERDKTGLDNSYVSEDYIPGSAIKGAIATLLGKLSNQRKLDNDLEYLGFKSLSKHLDNMVFTHAQPAKLGPRKRGHPLPQSIVNAKNKFYDIAWKDSPGLIDNEAPRFSTDWKFKDWTAAGEDPMLNLPAYLDDNRSLMLHAAHDKETGASKDHELFSIEAINPEGHQWLANISLPKGTDQKGLLAELKELFAMGLHWLGKTEASAKVHIVKPFLTPSVQSVTEGQRISITLLSSAHLLPIGTKVASTNGGNQLLEAYKKSWRDLSNNSLELVRFFADQQLIGGEYLHKRYAKENQPYNPRLFTKAGGVFVFDVIDSAKAEPLIMEWCKYGLPQLAGVCDNWRDNPYIAENGYGEIAVNLATAPSPEESDGWQPIEEIKA